MRGRPQDARARSRSCSWCRTTRWVSTWSASSTPPARATSILTGTLGPLENIERIVERYRIQHIVVLPGAVGDELLAELVALGRRRVIDVTVLTDYAGLVFHQARVGDLQGRPVIFYPRDTRYLLDRFAKRALDLVAATAFAVVVASGSMCYTRSTRFPGRASPSCVGERLGARGEPLAVPVAGSGRPDGPSDFVNLPLFWLVVIGKMSIVGPYPLRAEDAVHVGRVGAFGSTRAPASPGTGAWDRRASARRSPRAGRRLRAELVAPRRRQDPRGHASCPCCSAGVACST